MADYLIKEETLTDIADAIRKKKDYPSTTTFTPAQMATEISTISTGSGGSEIPSGLTATQEDVLSTKYFVGANGTKQQGSMTNNGDVSVTLNASSPSYTIPLGYHDGAGKVSMEEGYIKPSGTYAITSNGNAIDVKKYAYVNVAVPASGGGSTDNSKLLQILARSVTELTANDLAECANIAKYALSYCSLLTDVTIPNTVTFIGDYAFYQCSSLANLSIGSGVISIGDNAFTNCDGLTSVTIPNSVNKIVKSAFRQCDNLNSVVIGSGVTSIGDQAFYYCPLLESVTVNATIPPTLSGTMVFTGCSENLKIYVPSASLNAYKGASNWSALGDKMEGV